ncbi:sodium-dependent transporter yocR [Candidatus Photodesmus katoptron]|uniref:Sodium:neurotransmitter symporter n=1 Tax=Candidatus Photodesmus katoptron Akat1 TaxID=1236703 RepID=S3DHN5_9GAMM|nr:sodium-dependent transporter [Candidatus Photodesmus katoptron]EPE37195.1 sodium:neurotransmitter symporter [Candidatus Photodesmus katoptron Akat1]KEY90150.1 sodium-dependent transporter yocR [Candidatus Photodesmus katoptron]
MASNSRNHFSSKFGFIMAAAGSAIGLGNIWGFPTQTANNGGAVFLIIYLLMVFLLAFPILVAELTIGRYAQSNPIRSLKKISPKWKISWIAIISIVAVSLILSFYAIIAGWLIGYFISNGVKLLGMNNTANWLTTFSIARNLMLMIIFMLLTMLVVRNGIANGIEKCSTYLMPLLLVLFIIMTIYIFTQSGAKEGLKMYLIPDFSHLSFNLAISAMGQAFFSLSLGVCTMMVYGSYLKKDTNLPTIAAQVAIFDTAIAFIAGLLILPAMFVAQNNGVQIFSESGKLLHSDTLVFKVLPNLFNTMGTSGLVISSIFFLLMIIATLTSSISMLEVPVSCAIEELNQSRSIAVTWISVIIITISSIIIWNFNELFSFFVQLTTVYMQPIIGLFIALISGWLWNRNKVLQELKKGYANIQESFFWKIWPIYIKIICPIFMLLIFFH